MRFALIDNKLVEASPGLNGICPGCAQVVIAKCGTQRIHHWAHRNNKACDNWWEPETMWHRSWKNNFPTEWQEIFLPDERTGEKHVADVRTSHGLVIEFQHSHIDSQERANRETFYKNMVWVVDGTRLKRDYPRFTKAKKEFRKTDKQGIFFVEFPDECFSSNWLGSSVPVIFDFRGVDPIDDRNDIRSSLYCLFPILRRGEYAVVAEISRKGFINTTLNGEWLSRAHNLMDKLTQEERALQNQIAKQRPKTIVRRRESPYILEHGRWKRRRRF
jgi:competence protein CoiA